MLFERRDTAKPLNQKITARRRGMNAERVLVAGGGIAGMSFALRMRRYGWSVDLVESDPDWRVYGAGISITGPTFRAFKRLGLLEDLRKLAFCCDFGARINTPAGQTIADVPAMPLEPGLPVVGGIMRPVLHKLLSIKTREAGVDVRLGVTMQSVVDEGESIAVTTSDGQTRDYALTVAADGVSSKTRTTFFPDAGPLHYTGQYCWRLVESRPESIDRANFYMAGQITAGVMPVSPSQLYMFLLHPEPVKIRVDEQDMWTRLKQMMAPFGGVLGEMRERLTSQSVINCRPLESILVPPHWHRGRMVLIGDAVHATTPHLASGAGIAVEDALVLSELLSVQSSVPAALEQFTARRFPRCRTVVENSVSIGAMQLSDASPERLKKLMTESELALRQDI
jgi:2-polyprenyl-6-methoxyphenol hydroxylase-like FAD-dependent oxidoreductase